MSETERRQDGKAGTAASRHRTVAISLAALVAGMVGLSYAAVPLYRMFCQATGYAGTTQRAEKAPGAVLDRTVLVRFDANTSPGLSWRFEPVQRQMRVRIGESNLAFFRATNASTEPTIGTAAFNVTPEEIGRYFSKVQCFCFTEQKLEAGATRDMPVSFFIDPEMVDDPDVRGVQEVTLSYTFYPVAGSEKVAVKAGRNGSGS